MSRSRSLAALLAAVLLLIAPASAQTFGLGRTATPAEIAGWDIDARGDGAGLPPGRGSVKDGETLYADKCLSCHGDFGEGRDRWPAIAGGAGTLKESDPEKTAGSYWPTAPTLFDYIRRAMPYGGGLTLTPDETYAITAYVLYLNGLLEEDEAIDRDRLAAFRMPNAEGFVRIDDQKPDVVGDPCMTNCREGPVRITSDLARRLEVTPGQHTRRTGLEGAAPRPTAAAA
ncbi:MAG: cytochrome c, partial [Alphaproteobacteria bacterium]|nr:cytochrome c [Alphaproteobacteria bacterium]